MQKYYMLSVTDHSTEVLKVQGESHLPSRHHPHQVPPNNVFYMLGTCYFLCVGLHMYMRTYTPFIFYKNKVISSFYIFSCQYTYTDLILFNGCRVFCMDVLFNAVLIHT